MEPVELPTDALVVGGSNVLAVEVHQAAGGHPDLRFGAELFVNEVPRPPQAMPACASTKSRPPGPVRSGSS